MEISYSDGKSWQVLIFIPFTYFSQWFSIRDRGFWKCGVEYVFGCHNKGGGGVNNNIWWTEAQHAN